MKLAVVIPVYRVEDTLDRCVGSVLAQDCGDDMEVILVDDGSPDRCPQMCDEWARRDARVHVIHKVNGGLSDARNAGIAASTADYVTFVDSDDYLDPGIYGVLMAQRQHDILEYSVNGRLLLADCVYHSADDYWLQGRAYAHCYAWNKIYRRSLFHGETFPVGRLFEDVYALPALLRRAGSIATTSLGGYNYTDNPLGITATAGGEGLRQLLDAHLASGMPVDDDYYMHLLNIQMDVWEQTGAGLTLPRRHVNAGGMRGVQRCKAIMLNMLGLKTLCRINKLIHRLTRPVRS